MRPFLSEQQLGEPFTGLPDTMVVFRTLEFYYRDGETPPPPNFVFCLLFYPDLTVYFGIVNAK